MNTTAIGTAHYTALAAELANIEKQLANGAYGEKLQTLKNRWRILDSELRAAGLRR